MVVKVTEDDLDLSDEQSEGFMNLVELARINGMGEEEFVEELCSAFAAVMSAEISKDGDIAKISHTFGDHKILVIAIREDV